jgi:hypothetical protein
MMDGWICGVWGWMVCGWMDGYVWVNKRVDGLVEGWMGGFMNGWMDGGERMCGWMSGVDGGKEDG